MMKKQLIMEKALELFAQQGIEATPVQQITDYCGISKGAFYLSFKSKDELILALVDHFMIQIIADIDYTVKNTGSNEELLYTFYYTTFQSFHKHSDFAKIFIKEQTQSFNEELIVKIHYYDRLMEGIILSLIERLYGEKVKHTKYDLIYCIKGLMNSYSALFLFNNAPLDRDLLCQSLVEKTKLLARHTTVPFITHEDFQMLKHPIKEEITKEQIIEMIEKIVKEIEEPIVKESLFLLKDQLLEPALSPAIVKGLLENIRQHPHCKWVSYLLFNYYAIEK